MSALRGAINGIVIIKRQKASCMSFQPHEGHSSHNRHDLPTTPFLSAGQLSVRIAINIPQALYRDPNTTLEQSQDARSTQCAFNRPRNPRVVRMSPLLI